MDLKKGLKDISERLNQSAEDVSEKVLQSLDKVGSRLVELARNTKTYKDNTGNLTASIGYGVYHKGKEYSVGGFGDGEGGRKGIEKLESAAAKHKDRSYILIIVAGMEYAVYVERNGYVVLDAAELQYEDIAKEELSKVKLYGFKV